MAKNKTTQTAASVTNFLNSIPDETKRRDCIRLADLMKEQSGLEPKMWGPAIVGFGTYHYKYESGREGDAPLAGFSPRKNAITLYLASNYNRREELMKKFGKHKTSVACIYFKKLSDIDIDILKEMVRLSVSYMKSKYPSAK